MALRLLMLDDQPEQLSHLPEIVRTHGHEVLQAQSIMDAARILSTDEIDLLFLDIMMPHGDEVDETVPPAKSGIEVLRKIRSGEPIAGYMIRKDLPVIVITGLNNTFDLSAIHLHDPLEVIQKPVSIYDHVLPAIEAFERSHHK